MSLWNELLEFLQIFPPWYPAKHHLNHSSHSQSASDKGEGRTRNKTVSTPNRPRLKLTTGSNHDRTLGLSTIGSDRFDGPDNVHSFDDGSKDTAILEVGKVLSENAIAMQMWRRWYEPPGYVLTACHRARRFRTCKGRTAARRKDENKFKKERWDTIINGDDKHWVPMHSKIFTHLASIGIGSSVGHGQNSGSCSNHTGKTIVHCGQRWDENVDQSSELSILERISCYRPTVTYIHTYKTNTHQCVSTQSSHRGICYHRWICHRFLMHWHRWEKV